MPQPLFSYTIVLFPLRRHPPALVADPGPPFSVWKEVPLPSLMLRHSLIMPAQYRKDLGSSASPPCSIFIFYSVFFPSSPEYLTLLNVPHTGKLKELSFLPCLGPGCICNDPLRSVEFSCRRFFSLLCFSFFCFRPAFCKRAFLQLFAFFFSRFPFSLDRFRFLRIFRLRLCPPTHSPPFRSTGSQSEIRESKSPSSQARFFRTEIARPLEPEFVSSLRRNSPNRDSV